MSIILGKSLTKLEPILKPFSTVSLYLSSREIYQNYSSNLRLEANTNTFLKTAFIKERPLLGLIDTHTSSTKIVGFSTNKRDGEKPTACSKEDEGPIGRYLYHCDCEEGVNKQITRELEACYVYLSMACYFGRTSVALPGCQSFFERMHDEEHGHATGLINYQMMRGGHVELYPIEVPKNQDWSSIQNALSASICLEKSFKDKLLALRDIAKKHKDVNLEDFITANYIEEQDRSICELSRLLVRAKSMGCGIGEYLFDKELHRAFKAKSISDEPFEKEKKDPKWYL